MSTLPSSFPLPSPFSLIMQPVDIIISVLLIVGFIGGLRDGLVKQVAGLTGLICGLFIGREFYVSVGEWMTSAFGLSVRTAHITAFVLILVLVPLLFNLLGWFVSKMLSAIKLGWINRLLGGVVGVLKFAIFVGVAIVGIEFFDQSNTVVSKEQREASVLYNPIHKATGVFFSHIKQELGKLDLSKE